MINNNIKALLAERNISIRKLARNTRMDYSLAHALVNRKDLTTTQFGTIKKVADYLGVKIEEIYEKDLL